ncbi:nucleolar protein 10-like [Oncorhynchus tshawytscha]|uniref:nucleolar protein 10-like n=1 Tax=Oncorhynchus tshawytscha TaxID=74940 RepID=UPI000D09EF56|nr:nucleolar protein 10-like [Oncorhynchus tshawytscha]
MRSDGTATQPCLTRTPPRTRLRAGSPDSSRLRASLVEHYGTLNVADTAVGSKHLTFTLKKSEQQQRRQQAERDHHAERKKLRRSAGHLSSERGPEP